MQHIHFQIKQVYCYEVFVPVLKLASEINNKEAAIKLFLFVHKHLHMMTQLFDLTLMGNHKLVQKAMVSLKEQGKKLQQSFE